MSDDDVQATDVYLANLPEDQRVALEHLRRTIAKAAPAATEARSATAYPRSSCTADPLVSFGAAKAHCAFYLMSTGVMDAHLEELRGYQLGKGLVRFQPDALLPEAPVRTLAPLRASPSSRRPSKA